MINLRVMCVAAALAGCGGKKTADSDWTAPPLDQTVATNVDGHGFKISMPKGWIFDGGPGDKVDDPKTITKAWRPDVQDYFAEPRVAVAFKATPIADLDAFVKDLWLDANKDVVVKKQQTADGFVVVAHTKDNGLLRAALVKRKGDVQLECTATQAKNGGVPSADAVAGWLEQLCNTLALD